MNKLTTALAPCQMLAGIEPSFVCAVVAFAWLVHLFVPPLTIVTCACVSIAPYGVASLHALNA